MVRSPDVAQAIATAGDTTAHGKAARQLLVFVNPFSATSLALAARAASVAAGRPGWRLGAFVDASRHRPPTWPALAVRRLGAVVARRCFGPRSGGGLEPGTFLSPTRLARRFGAPLVVPEGRNLNGPSFRERVRREYPGAVALVLESLQLFGDELLSGFSAAVNYHDGALPAYRGVAATAWSVYDGEAESGFAFHRMDTGIDTGPVLVEGRVPVPPDATTAEVLAAKTRAAMASLPGVLDALDRGDPGRAQVGPARYTSRAARRRVRTVREPSSLSGEELLRRLRAFGSLTLGTGPSACGVTALRPARAGERAAFVAADGVPYVLHRCRHLPPRLYRAVRHVLPAEP